MTAELKYKAIIFDFDGVLADSVDIKGKAFRKMYEHHGDEIADRVYDHHMKNGGVSRREKFVVYEKEFFDKDLSPAELEKMCQKFSDIVTSMVIEADEITGAAYFLEKYQEKLPLHVASATPYDELIDIIRKRKMQGYFKSIKGSPAKKSDNILAILQDDGLEPEDVVMIGDSKTDYDAALTAGVDFIGVGDDAFLRENSRVMIADLTELEGLTREYQ